MKTDSDKMLLEKRLGETYFEESLYDMLKPEMIEQTLEVADQTKDQEASEISGEDSEVLLEVLNEQVGAKHLWQIIGVSAVTFAVALSVICAGLLMGRGEKSALLDKTQTKLEKANNDLAKAEQKSQTFESQLTVLSGEHKTAAAELVEAKAEIETLRGQLTDANRRIKSLQEKNDLVLKRLQDRLQALN